METIAPLLPVYFTLDGKPYTLEHHFPFEELFRTRTPKSLLLKTGRQVGKSTSITASSIAKAITIPYFKVLFIAPLYRHIERLSVIYAASLLERSAALKTLDSEDSRERDTVLNKILKNGSILHFSHACIDVVRVLGIPADLLVIDEVQDMNPELIPEIIETLSASEYAWKMYAGTPRTLDNTIEQIWSESSQAEWFIPCYNCKTNGKTTWNIPSKEYHILDMIGPFREDISLKNPAVVCHKCRKPIDPSKGRWVHRYPDKKWDNCGLHIPQIILPIHYSKPSKWKELLAKQSGKMFYSPQKFWNEVLGESFDVGAKLVGLEDLKAAMTLDSSSEDKIKQRLKYYTVSVAGIDWGGGGESETSSTVIAIMGITPTGIIEVPYACKLMQTGDHMEEAQIIKRLLNKFKVHYIAHDYTGAGWVRETVLVQSGISSRSIIPIAYTGHPSSGLIRYLEPSLSHPRGYYTVNRSRSLLITCTSIKAKKLFFFKNLPDNSDPMTLLSDFVNLVGEKRGNVVEKYFIVKKNKNVTDDFAHSVNIGCIALWKISGKWPKFAEV